MSDVLKEKAILETLLRELSDRCRFCGCTGHECKTATGEPCELMGEMRNRCSGVACEVRYYGEKRQYERGGKRKAGGRRLFQRVKGRAA